MKKLFALSLLTVISGSVLASEDPAVMSCRGKHEGDPCFVTSIGSDIVSRSPNGVCEKTRGAADVMPGLECKTRGVLPPEPEINPDYNPVIR